VRNYMPVKKDSFGMYLRFNESNKKQYYTPHLKYPIGEIKIDESYYAGKQEMFKSDVFYMLVNFDRKAWEPVMIDKSGLLIDGYHRVEVAKQQGLSFIDVVIQDTDLLEGGNKKGRRWKEKTPSKV